jgi:uncharacterized protein YeaO (DUF488 family)
MRAELKTKRWDDLVEEGDGTRILITRYRPRGLPKESETWQEWRREVAPSEELLAAFHGKGGGQISWAGYVRAYLREMKKAKEVIEELARRVAGGETVTLLCSSQCVRENRCHRSLLRELIEAEVERMVREGSEGEGGGDS